MIDCAVVNVKYWGQRCVRDDAGIECSDDEALNTEGHDEEVSRWEQEQIRKGISIPQVSSLHIIFCPSFSFTQM